MSVSLTDCSRRLDLGAIFFVLFSMVAVSVSGAGCAGETAAEHPLPGESDAGQDADAHTDTSDVTAPECVSNSDCAGVCVQGSCVAPSCEDGEANGEESDVDCGGSECEACTVGDQCQADTDCASGVCSGSGTCAAPTCADGVHNGTETDVDCGGECDECGDGLACAGAQDCESGVCSAESCQAATCSDGVTNGQETDTDCGGPDCSACAHQDTCAVDDDCTSGVCDADVCVAPTCTDNVANGQETDIDCGGGDCPSCQADAGCQEASDCVSGVCTANVCQAASCTDAVLNGQETDIDCGGTTCSGCAEGQSCQVDADCAGGRCLSSTSTCSAPNTASLRFSDSSGSRAVAPKTNSLTVKGDFTAEAWVKPSISGTHHNIMGWRNSAWRWRLTRPSAGNAGVQWVLLRYEDGSYETFESPTQVPLGQWTHLAITYDSTTYELRFFVNGTLDATFSGSHKVLNTPWSDLEFGFYGNTNSEYFRGLMDELRIWSVARTTAEINNTMAMPLSGSESGLKSYWDGEDQNPGVLTDVTVNGNDANSTNLTYDTDTPF